ncbi:hypothetical protein FRC11_002121, partial [Ceratobasidium sp. 423]
LFSLGVKLWAQGYDYSHLATTAMTAQIPSLPSFPVIRNLTGLDDNRLSSLHGLQNDTAKFIVSIFLKYVCISTVELARSVLSEKRFRPVDDAQFVRSSARGEGSSSAIKGQTGVGTEKSCPASTFDSSVETMFDDMVDVVSQLVLKWERFGPQYEIDLVDNGTRLALDTIALCTSKYQLNSFYFEQPPQAVAAMNRLLSESNKRVFKPRFIKALPLGASAKYRVDIKMMSELVSQAQKGRVRNPVVGKLSPDSISQGKNPRIGIQSIYSPTLRDIDNQARTLAAWAIGYEGTACMLPSMIGQILKHPEVYDKIHKEIDTVLGQQPIRLEDLGCLTYLT